MQVRVRQSYIEPSGHGLPGGGGSLRVGGVGGGLLRLLPIQIAAATIRATDKPIATYGFDIDIAYGFNTDTLYGVGIAHIYTWKLRYGA